MLKDEAVAFEEDEVEETPLIELKTCLTIASMSCELAIFYLFPFLKCYLIHRLSTITQRLFLVNVAALVRPSPVLEAIVNVQKPSPPKPMAA